MTNWLMFIGIWGAKGVYTPQSFIDEAQRLGVSRAVPRHIAAQMRVGDIIYCAFFNPRGFDLIPRGHKGYFRAQYKEGDALVFAYFAVSGISVRGADQECIQRLEQKGIIGQGMEVNIPVARACGGYIIKAAYELKTTDLGKVIKELPKKAKIMITGRAGLQLMNPEHILRDVSFSRVPKRIDLNTAQMEPISDPKLSILSHYERRFHPAKKRIFSWMRRRGRKNDRGG